MKNQLNLNACQNAVVIKGSEDFAGIVGAVDAALWRNTCLECCSFNQYPISYLHPADTSWMAVMIIDLDHTVKSSLL